MTVFVFTGSTLSPEEVRTEIDCICLPPVAQGDVYRVALKRPQAIGIIDGYFDRVPAVWHKEILWAMTQGIHVFGSASMGALRAAELAPFGMEGVGQIFAAYQVGILEDDDEVALVHSSAETNYAALSEPMVNIRFTLLKAEAEGVLNQSTRIALEQIAKSLFYPDRLYPIILHSAVQQGLPVMELNAFAQWLPNGRVDQKREDAIAMLRKMREILSSSLKPKQASFKFQHTELWEKFRQQAGHLQLNVEHNSETLLQESLLDELRLDYDAYLNAWQTTMIRLLALSEARRRGLVVDADMLHDTIIAFRRDRGLLHPEHLDHWMEAHYLNREQFLHLMEEETQMRWIEALAESDLIGMLPNHLRVTNQYTSLLERATHKQQILNVYGLENPNLTDVGFTDDGLMRWYFNEHLGWQSIPDIAHHVRTVGFSDEDSFRRAVLCEFCYCLKTMNQQLKPID
jgi:hypothetical protein